MRHQNPWFSQIPKRKLSVANHQHLNIFECLSAIAGDRISKKSTFLCFSNTVAVNASTHFCSKSSALQAIVPTTHTGTEVTAILSETSFERIVFGHLERFVEAQRDRDPKSTAKSSAIYEAQLTRGFAKCLKPNGTILSGTHFFTPLKTKWRSSKWRFKNPPKVILHGQ